MPRSIGDPEQFVEAYRLYTAGYKQGHILEKLKSIYRAKAVKLRTLGDWIKKFKDLPDEEKENSKSIDWHNLDGYHMGWEIGRGIGYFHDWEGHMPSRRLIKWWWRLNQIGGWSDEKLMLWAKKYEEYEIKKAFQINTADLSELDTQMLTNRRSTKGISSSSMTNSILDDNMNDIEDNEKSDLANSQQSNLTAPRDRNVRGYSSFKKMG